MSTATLSPVPSSVKPVVSPIVSQAEIITAVCNGTITQEKAAELLAAFVKKSTQQSGPRFAKSAKKAPSPFMVLTPLGSRLRCMRHSGNVLQGSFPPFWTSSSRMRARQFKARATAPSPPALHGSRKGVVNMITYFLIVYLESVQQWHVADELRTEKGLSFANSVLHNTHPRLRGLWAVVASFDLEEATHSTPTSLFA